MSTPGEEVTVDLNTSEGAEVAERSVISPDGTRIAPENVEIQVETAPEPKKEPKKSVPPVVPLDEGLEKLKKQLEDEKLARIAAENRARDASEAELRAKTESQGTQLDLIKSAISSVTQANDVLEEKYAAALAAQDWGEAAKAQREMSANEARLVELNRGKTAMEKAPKIVPRVSNDPVEVFAQQVIDNGYPRSAAWIRAHPEFVRDERKRARMMAASNLAIAEGFAADTPEYFAHVEDTLKLSAPRVEVSADDDDATSDAARPSASRPSRQVAPPSAPVSRSGNGTGGNRSNVVTLTPEQVEAAQMMKMTPEQYAKELIALRKEGKLN